jgi:hypothetical protein
MIDGGFQQERSWFGRDSSNFESESGCEFWVKRQYFESEGDLVGYARTGTV